MNRAKFYAGLRSAPSQLFNRRCANSCFSHILIAIANGTPQGFLSVVWKELDGPAVKEPLKKNFGTTSVRQSLEYELGGSADLQFNKSGLKCVLEIPLSKTNASVHQSP
jgi:two-component sensor histidine kinase